MPGTEFRISSVAAASVGEQDSRLFRIAAVIQRHVADPLHELRARRARQLAKNGVALAAVPDAGTHLDELVVVQGPIEFRDQVRPDAGLTDQNDRIAIVSKSSQVLALGFGE